MTEDEENAAKIHAELKLVACLSLYYLKIQDLCLQFSNGKIAWNDPKMTPVRRMANWHWN